MEAYYDASITASILLQEVMKELKIRLNPCECCKNGMDKKIFRKCKQIIEKEYSDKDYQDLLKLYISSYFIEDSIEEDGVVYEDFVDGNLEINYDSDIDESVNLTK